MKRRYILAIFLLSFLIVSVGSPAFAQTYPPRGGFVNDFAAVLSRGTISLLERQLDTLKNETGAEMAVVTVRTLDGGTIEEYAAGLYDAWDLGKEDNDRGVLILMAIDARRAHIQVGRGLESIITGGRTGRAMDRVVPPLNRGNFKWCYPGRGPRH